MRRVTAIVVTWNRARDVLGVLEALSKQVAEGVRLEAIVVDNASTDGTATALRDAGWVGTRVENEAEEAHEPRFTVVERVGTACRGAISGVTVIRNARNFGGCGGFNTGMLAVECGLGREEHQSRRKAGGPVAPREGGEGSKSTDVLAEARDSVAWGADARKGMHLPEFIWLVDDDVDLPEDALARLLEAADSDERIGLVGSRTCDLADRERTIESTIYVDAERGVMTDDPPASHRLHESHRAWVQTVGSAKGGSGYRGVREVDVVSACSMLARWRAVEEVGFWDKRFFIYCDDADWCLRMARAGWRVVLSLDAVVYHTPWHQKLTPARAYYAQRNLLWMLAKMTPASEARRLVRARLEALFEEARVHALTGRIDHALVLVRACEDASAEVGGAVDLGARETGTLAEVMGRSRRKRAVVMVNRAAHWAEAKRVREAAPGVRWIECVRNDVPRAHEAADEGVGRIVYSLRGRSLVRRALGLWVRPPGVMVQFDRESRLPVLRHRWALHVRSGDEGEIERGGVWRWVAFSRRLRRARRRCLAWADRLRPGPAEDRFG